VAERVLCPELGSVSVQQEELLLAGRRRGEHSTPEGWRRPAIALSPCSSHDALPTVGRLHAETQQLPASWPQLCCAVLCNEGDSPAGCGGSAQTQPLENSLCPRSNNGDVFATHVWRAHEVWLDSQSARYLLIRRTFDPAHWLSGEAESILEEQCRGSVNKLLVLNPGFLCQIFRLTHQVTSSGTPAPLCKLKVASVYFVPESAQMQIACV
jgi:hypothetical protein